MRSKQKKYELVHRYPNYFERSFSDYTGLLYPDLSLYTQLCVELGCGYGEHSHEWCFEDPYRFAWGVDIKGDRLYTAIEKAKQLGIDLRWSAVRMDCAHVSRVFAPHSLDIVWITFPDPFSSKPVRSLAHSSHHTSYFTMLKPGGLLACVTDSLEVYQMMQEYDPTMFIEVDYTLPIVHSRYWRQKIDSVPGSQLYTVCLKRL